MTEICICINCGRPASKLVIYLNRRTQRQVAAWRKCDMHVQQEIMLASNNYLSMVDIDIRPLVEEVSNA